MLDKKLVAGFAVMFVLNHMYLLNQAFTPQFFSLTLMLTISISPIKRRLARRKIKSSPPNTILKKNAPLL